MHAFFRFFWPLSLISSRWTCEVESQEFAWVGCSKPSCFTRFWAGSGCGGLAGRRAWGALGASPGASGGLSGARRDSQGGLQRRLWQLLGNSGDLCGPPEAPRGPQMPPEAPRGPQRPPDAPEAPRGPQRPPEAPRGPQRPPETPRGSQEPPRGPQRLPEALEATSRRMNIRRFCLFVCLGACSFYKQAVNIRRSALTHYQKVVNI